MINTETKVKEMVLEAVITRADGTVQDLGAIQYWHQNPLKRFIWRIKQWLRS